MKLRFTCLFTMLLTACATSPPAPQQSPEAVAAQALRAQEIAAWSAWGLTARLGLDDGETGGSGRLDWRVGEDRSTLDFRGTLGRGAWRLDIDPSGVTLARGDGSTAHAATLSGLVAEETGLQLPVQALQWWVRGMPDPAAAHEWQLDEKGRLVELSQSGWRIHYKSYMDYGQWSMPRRLEATDGRQRVSLAIGKWWQGGAAPDA